MCGDKVVTLIKIAGVTLLVILFECWMCRVISRNLTKPIKYYILFLPSAYLFNFLFTYLLFCVALILFLKEEICLCPMRALDFLAWVLLSCLPTEYMVLIP